MTSSSVSGDFLEEAIRKADTLIEALGWIREFRDKTAVIKLGGSVLENDDALRHVLMDILFMETVGLNVVVVHGGGAAISRAMHDAGIVPRFVKGRRYTDQPSLEIVERILATELNEFLAAEFETLGGRAMSFNFRSTNVLYGQKLTLPGDGGESIDLGYVGEVTRVDRAPIDAICYAKQVPFIPSMCVDDAGQKYNVNADTAASAVAEALGADKLIYLSDVAGVLRDKNDPDTLINSLTESEARQLIAEGVIESGMIPKVEGCLQTLHRGVGKIHIIDGRLRHSLLLEIFTTRGVGTQILKE